MRLSGVKLTKTCPVRYISMSHFIPKLKPESNDYLDLDHYVFAR